MQPTVEAAEADLVLLRLALANDRYNNQYFVYKAPGCGGKVGPSLWRLDKPHQISLPYRHNIALLAHREVGHYYYMATFNHNPDMPQNFNLLLYNSMHKKWSSTPIPLDMTQIHIPGKAITLDEGGLLGFVDPWRGILVCDIRSRSKGKSETTRQVPYAVPSQDRSTTDDDNGPMQLPGGATTHTQEDTIISDDNMAVD
ncbi:hypothetical protein HU200_023269 [Digitaria exilis]|uniref:DUF1618 domain-containing protein n=1 Tax=Digitaria exilis TaxID=1010633 RepID=A0A835EWN5_9POAL|nr:hypothetical protein HU200_023269 [Digitaria exilis]